MTNEQTHYLNCLDANCDKFFCVNRREFEQTISKLREELDNKRGAMTKELYRMGKLNDSLRKECMILREAIEDEYWCREYREPNLKLTEADAIRDAREVK
jgi:hypothetical protein